MLEIITFCIIELGTFKPKNLFFIVVVVTCGVYFLLIVTHFFVFVMGNVCTVYKPRSLHDTEYIGMYYVTLGRQ